MACFRRRSVREMAASATRWFVSGMDDSTVGEGEKRQAVPAAPTGAADEVKRACGPDQRQKQLHRTRVAPRDQQYASALLRHADRSETHTGQISHQAPAAAVVAKRIGHNMQNETAVPAAEPSMLALLLQQSLPIKSPACEFNAPQPLGDAEEMRNLNYETATREVLLRCAALRRSRPPPTYDALDFRDPRVKWADPRSIALAQFPACRLPR